MRIEDLTVEVRDKTLRRRGIVEPENLVMTAEVVFNNVGSWSLTLPREHPMTPVLTTPGSGLLVTGPNDILFSGPVTSFELSESADAPGGLVVCAGVTDEILLADALCYPQPGNPDATTQTLGHDKRTGLVEDVMHAFVNANIGPSAPSARRGLFAQMLVLNSNGHRGPTTTRSARFDQLGTLLAELAPLADLGFRVVQRASMLSFETYPITDRTGHIRLSVENGTLASDSVAVSAPTATQVIVAGQGQDVDRAFYVGTNTVAQQAEVDWGRRIESWRDQRQTDDPNEYAAAADEVLANEGFTSTVATASPIDDSAMRFGHDWGLGDQVAVVVEDAEYSAPCTSFIFAADDSGVRAGIGLGDPSLRSKETAALRRVLSLARRIDAIERGQ